MPRVRRREPRSQGLANPGAALLQLLPPLCHPPLIVTLAAPWGQAWGVPGPPPLLSQGTWRSAAGAAQQFNNPFSKHAPGWRIPAEAAGARQRMPPFKASLGIWAACRPPERLPRPRHGENGLGRPYHSKREVPAAGLSARCSPPRRELLSCAGLECGGRSLVAHLLLPVLAELRGERTHGACWRGPVPDICCQPQGPGWQEGTGVRQRSVMLEAAGCWKCAER